MPLSSSPLLWRSRWISSLSSLLLPPEMHEKFETLLRVIHNADEVTFKGIDFESNEVTVLCQTKAISFTFVALALLMLCNLVVGYLTHTGWTISLFRVLVCILFLIIIRFKLMSPLVFAYFVCFVSLFSNGLVVYGHFAKNTLPPFMVYFTTFLPVTPLTGMYLLRSNQSIIIFAATVFGCYLSFLGTVGREISFHITHESSFFLYTSSMLVHVLPLLYFTLYQAETQIYHTLLTKMLRNSERKNEAKTQFISRMSHELRTPLHGLLSSVSLLRQTKVNEEQESYLTIIDSCGDLVLDIVFKILDITKIESGRFESHAVDFSLFDVVGSVSRSMASLAEAKGMEIGINFELDDEGYDVHGDKAHFHEILVNFTGNAIKYSDHGSISIRVSKKRAPAAGEGHHDGAETLFYRLEVQDTGRGIAPEYTHWIFEPFAQVPSHLKKIEGNGLGLSISKKIAEALGGRIGVDSKVGHGSTFWVEIPFKPLPAGTLSFPLNRIPWLDEGRGGAAARWFGAMPARIRDEVRARLLRTEVGIIGRGEFTRTVTNCLQAWGVRFEVLERAEGGAYQGVTRFRHLLVDESLDVLLQLASQDHLALPHLQGHTAGAAPEVVVEQADRVGRVFTLHAQPESQIAYFTTISEYSVATQGLEKAGLEALVGVLMKPVGPSTVLKALGLLLGFEHESNLQALTPPSQQSPAASDSSLGDGTASPRPLQLPAAPSRNEGEGSLATQMEKDLALRVERIKSQKARAQLITDEVKGSSPSQGAQASPQGSLDVLVVEDNPVSQMIVKKQLEKLGVRFAITPSGEEGVEIWRSNKQPIPLVFMDVEVEGSLTGLEATRKIRELEELMAAQLPEGEAAEGPQHQQQREQRDKSLSLALGQGNEGALSPSWRKVAARTGSNSGRSFVAMLTGRALDSDQEEAFSCGCDAFLVKPVKLEIIRELVNTMIGSGPTKSG